jgi:tetratricopeptide (TPR) repeat protein
MNMIICFKNLNNNEMALKLAKQAITIEPYNVNSWIAAGWSAYDLERYKDADNFFNSALGCDIRCPDALFGKASVMKIRGKDYSHFQKALAEVDSKLVI